MYLIWFFSLLVGAGLIFGAKDLAFLHTFGLKFILVLFVGFLFFTLTRSEPNS